jgi:hypothetical protein
MGLFSQFCHQLWSVKNLIWEEWGNLATDLPLIWLKLNNWYLHNKIISSSPISSIILLFPFDLI